jgi:hypothetical protein
MDRFFAHGTGVDDDQARLFGRIDRNIVDHLQERKHPLGIVDIHLAPVGGDEDTLSFTDILKQESPPNSSHSGHGK